MVSPEILLGFEHCLMPRSARPLAITRGKEATTPAGVTLVLSLKLMVSTPPVLLATNPPTDSPSVPSFFQGMPRCRGCTNPPVPPAPRKTTKKHRAPRKRA